MRAAVVAAPGQLEVREVPEPKIGPYEALCAQLFGATCTGTDSHLIHGRFPWNNAYPFVLGHESVGRVVEVGSKVRHLKPGDVVTRVGWHGDANSGVHSTWGGFAEWGVAVDWRAMQEDGRPEQEWRRWRIHQTVPPDLDPRAATMFVTWRETFSCAWRMGFRDGGRVLILGSGGNGLAFASHARNLGASVVALTGAPGREASARAAGATLYVDYASPDPIGRLRDAQSEGFDFVIDAVGRAGMLDDALPLCAKGGTLALYGIDEIQKVQLTPDRARGSFTFYKGGYDEAEAHEAVVDLMRSGKLDAGVWLDLQRPYPLERIGEAFEALGRREAVKALIRLSAPTL